MNGHEKVKTLVNISRMYYEHNYSQQEISEKLGLSRTYISKLLNEAREKGIVDIRVNDPLKAETEMEERLRKDLSLQKAIIVPTADSDGALPEKLGAAAAEYLNLIIKDNDTIGVSWGKTIYALSLKTVRRTDMENIHVVQVCGGVSKMRQNVYASDIPKNMADALGGDYELIPLPAVLGSVAARNAVMKDNGIAGVMSLARRADIALFTAGAFRKENVFIEGGYFSEKDFVELRDKGAVGDICSHIIDGDGNLCDMQLERRTAAISLDDIAAIPVKICVAAGGEKVDSILAAIKIGCVDVLVTNERTAGKLLK